MSDNLETIKTAIAKACANRLAQQTDGIDGRAVLTAPKLAELQRNLAFYQSDAFASLALADKINVGFIDGTNGAIWLDLYACTRLTGFVKMVLAGIAEPATAKDMQRFSVRLMKTCMAAIAKGKNADRINKSDLHAMVTKGANSETAHGYAEGYISADTHHASEFYADSYAARQGKMTARAFESLGMVARIDEGNARSVSFQAVNGAFFKRARKVYLTAAG